MWEADTRKDGQSNNYPLWYISAHEISAALQKCNEIAGDGGDLDLSVLFRLRKAILHKLLKPMLSKIPGVGLATIAPNASSANNVASVICRECIAMGTSAAYTVMDSLSLYPDPAFLEAFCAAGAVEIAAICWYYTNEPGLRNMGTVSIDYLIHATTNKLALESLTKHLSAEMIVGRCKEILREFIGPNPMDEWHRGRMIQLLANMCDPTRSDLAIALSKNGVPGVLVEIADHVMRDNKADKELVTKMGGLLMVMVEFTPKSTPGLLATIEHDGTLQLIAQVFLDTSFLDVDTDSWGSVLEKVTHLASCLDFGCPRLCSDRGAATVARVLKQDDLWLKTSIALSTLVEERAPGPYKYAMKKRLGAWLDVGRAVGLSESALSNQVIPQASSAKGTAKVPRKDENGCRYGGCVRHGRIDEETEWMLLKCSGCKMARYCSKECQIQDWKKVHKFECKGLRKA